MHMTYKYNESMRMSSFIGVSKLDIASLQENGSPHDLLARIMSDGSADGSASRETHSTVPVCPLPEVVYQVISDAHLGSRVRLLST